MNIQITNPPPDVKLVQRMSNVDEVNDYLEEGSWVLLGILISRKTTENGGFVDKETYIMGLLRKEGE